jgi:hypothetical protein
MRASYAFAAILLLPTPAAAERDADQGGGTEHRSHHGSKGGSRPDDYAPLGVMGDHLHEAGHWMLSYRYGHMSMDGNRDGTDRVSTADVFADGFPVSPTDMDTDLHMFGLMYAPAKWLTVMAMIPYIEKSMNHVIGATGEEFRTDSSGPGDFRLTGLVRVLERGPHHLHVNLGVSFPTGDIDAEDFTPTPMAPMGFQKTRLPYPMQLGSGTFDVLLGATYSGRNAWLSWGGQATGTARTGENDNDYRVGDRVGVTAWVARPWTSWISTSLRLRWQWWDNYHGADPSLNPNAVPTADPKLRGGNRLDLLGGLNFQVPLGPLGEHRIAIEVGGPVHQWLYGPQLETDWHILVGWQKAFASPW